MPAAIAVAALVAAELVVSGRVDPVKTHARSMDFDGIAVDHARLPGNVVGARLARQGRGDNQQCKGAAYKQPPSQSLVQLNFSELRRHLSARA